MANIYYEKTSRDVVTLVNNTGADLALNDFTVIGPYAVIANEVIANGESGGFTLVGNIELHANEFVTNEDTFDTLYAKVFFDPTTKKFSDTSTAGYYHVGYVSQVKNTNGMIKFEKLRFATVVA